MLKVFVYLWLWALCLIVAGCRRDCGCSAQPKARNAGSGKPGTDSASLARQQEEYRSRLGTATWYLLHTMAAKYPDEPDPAQKQEMSDFLYLLGRTYPCAKCGKHFLEMIAADPPDLDSQETFSLWMCNTHNKVNSNLGKPQFPCDDVDSNYYCGCVVDDMDDTGEHENPTHTNPNNLETRPQGAASH